MHALPFVLAAGLMSAIAVLPAARQSPNPQLLEAEKMMQAGDVAGAAATLEKIVLASPNLFQPRLLLGQTLDLLGRYADARKHLEEAVKLAGDEERNTALTSLGISYAFESKPDDAARYYQRAFDAEMQADDRAAAAGLANAIGRIYLESGNLQKAEQWYTSGYEAARKISGLPASQVALWEMRWHHALGRIAARRGRPEEARKHADAVRQLLEKGGNDNQKPFYPYLLGYIAFFSKQYKQAIDELSKGDLEDPFVLGLIGQAYQRLGDRAKAEEYFRKVMAATSHSINLAFAQPVARAALR
jgi:tetratricopeptide (TPR) repeat protein